jgi:hypothetical protein
MGHLQDKKMTIEVIVYCLILFLMGHRTRGRFLKVSVWTSVNFWMEVGRMYYLRF